MSEFMLTSRARSLSLSPSLFFSLSYDTFNTNSLRLWSAMPDLEIDLSKFNEGEYGTALAARQRALEITQVTNYLSKASLSSNKYRKDNAHFYVYQH